MPKPKKVFIAHPMSGDIEGNTRKVIEILRNIHSEGIIPVFPSFTWRLYLGDSEYDRKLAAMVNEAYFRDVFIDEVWVYGDRLSPGMLKEIMLAQECFIPVIPKSPEMMALFKERGWKWTETA